MCAGTVSPWRYGLNAGLAVLVVSDDAGVITLFVLLAGALGKRGHGKRGQSKFKLIMVKGVMVKGVRANLN